MGTDSVSGDPLDAAAAALPDFLGGQKLEDGIGLCLSGGGFRAMLFHLGAFVRMNELGLLVKLERVASVSGGSLAAGVLAVAWEKLTFDEKGIATNLEELVAEPILNVSRKYIDTPAILLGLLPSVNGSKIASLAYDHYLFRGKLLSDLPQRPRFSFTATSLQSGALWRFARDYAADWRVGMWRNPHLSIADVVAASASFPPYLSPAYINVPAGVIEKEAGADLHSQPYTTRLCLTDGGVYDNLGLEPVWKRYRTILVSDGGAPTPPSFAPRTNWLSQSMRASNIALQQGINMRRRVLLGLERKDERKVAYWGIAEPVASYGVGNRLEYSSEQTRQAAEVATRLTKYPLDTRINIVRAGYAHADAALQASRIVLPHFCEPNFSRLPTIK